MGFVRTTSITTRSEKRLVGRDLVTLCERCLRRAVKLEHELGRPRYPGGVAGARSRRAAL